MKNVDSKSVARLFILLFAILLLFPVSATSSTTKNDLLNCDCKWRTEEKAMSLVFNECLGLLRRPCSCNMSSDCHGHEYKIERLPTASENSCPANITWCEWDAWQLRSGVIGTKCFQFKRRERVCCLQKPKVGLKQLHEVPADHKLWRCKGNFTDNARRQISCDNDEPKRRQGLGSLPIALFIAVICLLVVAFAVIILRLLCLSKFRNCCRRMGSVAPNRPRRLHPLEDVAVCTSNPPTYEDVIAQCPPPPSYAEAVEQQNTSPSAPSGSHRLQSESVDETTAHQSTSNVVAQL